MKKRLLITLATLMALIALPFANNNVAYALAPTGTLTGSVITVQNGETKAITTITVTDAGTAEITAVNDIRIQIGAGTDVTWDTSDTTATLGGTASAKAEATVTYPDSKTLLIDVTENFANSDTLTISGLSYIGTGSSAAAVLTWAIDGATYGPGNANTNITAVDVTLTGSIQTVDIGQIEAINTLTVTEDATTAQVTAVNDIRIKIPAGVNAIWDVSDTTATIAGTGAASVSATVSYPDTKTLLLNVTGDLTVGQTVTVADLSYIGVTAASTAAALQYSYDGGTVYFTANANTNLTIADDAEDTLTTLSVALSNAVASTAAVNYTVTFTVPATGVITKNGLITVTFPSGFNVAAATAGDMTGIDGTAVATTDGQVVTLTRQNDGTNATAGVKTVIISGVTNSATASDAHTLSVATKTAASLALASGTTSAFTVNSVAISNLTCEASGQGGAVWLRWTVPTGTSNGYEVKYEQGNSITYGTATAFTQSWTSGTVSTAQQQLLTGLNPSTQYTFAMKSKGTGAAISAISTLTPICYAPGAALAVVDTKAPVTQITSPAIGSTVSAKDPLVIKGSSMDQGGSSVSTVEVSIDNGATWNKADITLADDGNRLWQYTWAKPSAGSQKILVRANDWMGNTETPVALNLTVSTTLVSATPATPATPTTPAVPATPATPEAKAALIASIQSQLVALIQQVIALLTAQIQAQLAQ